MKIPITDQFLWMVYEFFEETGEILDPLQIFKVRGWRDVAPLETKIWDNLEKKRRKKQFAQFIYRLKKRGYIKIANLEGKKECF
jgi:hypothetical protein